MKIINKLKQFIYGSVRLEMSFDVPMGIAVDRLDSKVSKGRFSAGMVGSVQADHVAIERVIPMLANPFNPLFVGAFEFDGKKTKLSGVFRFHRFAQVIITYAFGFICIWTVAMITEVTNLLDALLAPFAGLLMFGLILGMVKIGTWSSRNDKDWIKRSIADAIKNP